MHVQKNPSQKLCIYTPLLKKKMNQSGVIQLGPIDEQTPLSQQQQNITVSVVSPRANNSGPNLPQLDLLEGPREDYLKIGVPLYEASIKCDWKAAKAILEKYKDMKLLRYSITENAETALHVAASAKGPKHVEEFVENLVKLMEKEDLALENKNFNTALYLAAAAGNIKTVKIMMEKNGTLLAIPGGGSMDNKPQMMPLYTAALFGNHEVVKYMYEKSKDLIDDGWTDVNRGWLLEKCVENDMFGKHYITILVFLLLVLILVMQAPEIRNMIPPSYRERKNKDDLTPHELFTKEHKDLVIRGEEWMKGTASQCMVVAALIATIVFAAAFTVPGGYAQSNDQASNQKNGVPVFHSKATFMVFVVADAISLFSSSASILMFLSILTSRYAERDFLESLPKKLMLGLAALFLSITTMTVAFSVSFFVLYHRGLLWIPILIGALAVLPVLLYIKLQYGLFVDVIRSTYGSSYLFKPRKHVLYYKNPEV
nr:ankyrin repeat-containing domain, PGG domain protein [Tanacetum cinerariifolium]